jgi:tetratricopeptide (TPR) repeat protein
LRGKPEGRAYQASIERSAMLGSANYRGCRALGHDVPNRAICKIVLRATGILFVYESQFEPNNTIAVSKSDKTTKNPKWGLGGNMRLLFSIAVPALIVCMQSPIFSQATPAPTNTEDPLHAGNALMDERKYCEALTRYKEGLSSSPDDTSLLYNGGLAAFQCKKYDAAVDLWRQLKNLDSSDWQARAKLIQAYQALGKLSERDQERMALFAMRKQGSNDDLMKQVEYCRDQFEAGGERVMAFEYFELKGDRAVRYVFSIVGDSKHKEKYRLSLGSYDTTNAVWHQTTKPRPKETDRLFHLDGYYDGGHATYGMYFPEPSYDEVRATVVEILEKKKSPMSTSTYGSSSK